MAQDIFFVRPGRGNAEQAKEICATCKVRNECLDDALANSMTMGIWGGEGNRGRRRIKRERKENGS